MKAPVSQADALLARARRLLHDHRTRARKDGCRLNYTLADIRRLIESSPCCAYCGMPVAFDLQLDHRRPIARGGQHVLANLAPCCARCNALKSVLTETEHRELLAFLDRLHPLARQNIETRLLAGNRRFAGKRSYRKPAPQLSGSADAIAGQGGGLP
jgi:5-methylcytosine-specific restriction endonuclease McrA